MRSLLVCSKHIIACYVPTNRFKLLHWKEKQIFDISIFFTFLSLSLSCPSFFLLFPFLKLFGLLCLNYISMNAILCHYRIVSESECRDLLIIARTWKRFGYDVSCKLLFWQKVKKLDQKQFPVLSNRCRNRTNIFDGRGKHGQPKYVFFSPQLPTEVANGQQLPLISVNKQLWCLISKVWIKNG